MTTMTHHSVLGLSQTGFHPVAYTQWTDGPPRHGQRTIVCVHGLTRNGRDFDVLARTLVRELGVRVVCPDVVGRGRSGRLANPDHYGYPQYLADMAVLLARLDVESVEWVGTSMGGLIGMFLAAQPNTPITRMVVNDIGPFVPKAALERIGTYVGIEHAFEDLKALEGYLRMTYAGFGELSDAEWAHLAEHSVRELPDGRLGLAYDTGIARIFTNAPVGDVDLWPVWRMIRCPMMVVRGAQSDLLLPETTQRMLVEGPPTRLLEVPRCGHAPALMAPEQVGPIVDFFREA